MTLTWETIQANAERFSRRWKDGKEEISEAQTFVRDFLAVFGVSDTRTVGGVESWVKKEVGICRMDFFWKSMIAIEMKSRGKDLKESYDQLKD
jgi:hypothetical protein